MQYLGGKSRIKKQISEILNKEIKNSLSVSFVSLFCGTCSIESLINHDKKYLNDSHSYLIQMFQDLQKGRDFPESVSQEEYYKVKSEKDLDKGLSAFVGFGCSFGGKWWGGYARQTKGLNYAKTAKNSLKKKMIGLNNATFTCKDYRNVEILDGSLVYCDPPYEGTTGYSNSEEFSHVTFWDYIRELSKLNKVFVSEIKAPDDFVSVWQKDFTRNLDADNVIKSVEKLFVHKSQVDKM